MLGESFLILAGIGHSERTAIDDFDLSPQPQASFRASPAGTLGNLAQDLLKPTQGQAFFYLGENVEAFADVFGAFGLVMSRHAE